MSTFEFFLSLGVICQVIMLCCGVLIVYYPAHQGRMGVERFRYLIKIFANTDTKTKPTPAALKGIANGIYTQ